MNNEETILKVRKRYDRIRQRNEAFFQETGIQRYQTTYHHAEDIVDICNAALSSADDHEKAIFYKAALTQLIPKAFALLRGGRYQAEPEKTEQLLKDLVAFADSVGVKDPWKSEWHPQEHKRKNETVKEMAYQAHIAQWEIAERIGVAAITLNRWLRCEISDKQYMRIINAIREIETEKSANK